MVVVERTGHKRNKELQLISVLKESGKQSRVSLVAAFQTYSKSK